ncbi:MAG: MurR/RpiR family transcriptional regulator [Nitrospinae bacterium]|nr:MurR/RpiR family transcriptional regulator [Nitrospinota bacterium]
METKARGAVSMSGGGAVSRIRGVVPSLQPAERRVAEYVLAHGEDLLAQSVGEVAAAADVSEATVIRFCRTARFLGFADLKIALARELVTPIASAIHEDITEKDDTATLARKVFGANIQTLNDTLSVVDAKAVDKAVDMLAGAGRILVIGVGTSAPIAMDAYTKFMRLGLSVTVQTDAHLMMMEAALLSKGDMIFAISHSGSTKDPVETIKAGKGAGARAVAVTNSFLSPIAKASDVALITASKETRFRSEALSSRIAQASILDLLYVALGMRDRKRTLSCIRRIEDVITSKQY